MGRRGTAPGLCRVQASHLVRLYDSLTVVYARSDLWCSWNCEPAGGHWEVYFSSPAEEPDGSRWRTVVVAPYTRKVA